MAQVFGQKPNTSYLVRNKSKNTYSIGGKTDLHSLNISGGGSSKKNFSSPKNSYSIGNAITYTPSPPSVSGPSLLNVASPFFFLPKIGNWAINKGIQSGINSAQQAQNIITTGLTKLNQGKLNYNIGKANIDAQNNLIAPSLWDKFTGLTPQQDAVQNLISNDVYRELITESSIGGGGVITQSQNESFFTGKNLLIVGAVVLGAFLLFKKR